MNGRTQPTSARVVLFTGGSGSHVLSKELIRDPRVRLTLAINGYDDGKSTGEVRRFLRTALGPSDFRKNAVRLARELGTCAPELLSILEHRFPAGTRADEAVDYLHSLVTGRVADAGGKAGPSISRLDASTREVLGRNLTAFLQELDASGYAFSFSDCSLGNLVYAGCFLNSGGDFNATVDECCDLLGLPQGVILNVTDGRNSYLVALDQENRLLSSEAEIVENENPARLQDIFLIDREPTEAEKARLARASIEEILSYLSRRAATVKPNPLLLERIREADLIVYAPGTQYSSLYPSYLTPGLGQAIARNLRAVKLLVTNIQEDMETRRASAVELIDLAVYYLREKNRIRILTPCLITHYLINDSRSGDPSAPYLSLGSIENLEDPRLVRIGHYEDGASGRHSAAKIITPYMRALVTPREPPRVGVLLLETDSLDKISQTILESLRGGIAETAIRPTFFYCSPEELPETFVRSLPVSAHNIFTPGEAATDSFSRVCRSQRFEYVVLFESSGMYRGEDIVNLAGHMTWGRLDAVWGSRRLSPTEIHESYRFRYRRNPVLGAISYVGSHLLSLMYLLLYGRFVTDTLSGARAIRGDYLHDKQIHLGDPCLNQHLLSRILRSRGDIFETPVKFLPISPDKVHRTTIRQGLLSLTTMFAWRVRRSVPLRPAAEDSELEGLQPPTASRSGLPTAPVT